MIITILLLPLGHISFKNRHGAYKIIDTFKTYQLSTFEIISPAVMIRSGVVDGGHVITRTIVGMLFYVGVLIN
jgi:hypothetical protein